MKYNVLKVLATPAYPAHSSTYFEKNTQWVSQVAPTSDISVRSLLICFLTIQDIRILLLDPKTNLAEDIADDFIRNVLIVDFNRIINVLSNYNGTERRGIKESLGHMNYALRFMYDAQNASLQKNRFKIANTKIKALISCRDKLQQAFLQLEYLKGLAEKFTKNS